MRRKVWIRPNGSAYHIKKDCELLTGSQFESYGYFEVTEKVAIEKGYILCPSCGDYMKRG